MNTPGSGEIYLGELPCRCDCSLSYVKCTPPRLFHGWRSGACQQSTRHGNERNRLGPLRQHADRLPNGGIAQDIPTIANFSDRDPLLHPDDRGVRRYWRRGRHRTRHRIRGATPAPVVAFDANPASIAPGASSSLTWSSSDATTCTASGGWAGNKTTSGSEPTAALTASTSFGLTCSGAGGSTTKTVDITVVPPGTAVTLTANPAAVAAGSSSTLSWSSTNATSCVASGGWSGPKATSGTEASAPVAATTSFTLTCTGPSGSVSQTATVTVATPAPTVSLSANPTAMPSGSASTLTWGSTDASSCSASGALDRTRRPPAAVRNRQARLRRHPPTR